MFCRVFFVVKASLQLNIGQSLTMTPQLQQAIRLLQLSTLELQSEIQSALDNNPLLETGDEEGSTETDDNPIDYRAAEESLAQQQKEEPASTELDMNNAGEMPNELPVDSAWDDVYSNSASATDASSDDDDNLLESRNAAPETLSAHLSWQLNLTLFSDTDRYIATVILDGIDERGYLTQSLDDILATVQDPANPEDIEIDEVEAVLHRIQQFDPPGVGARNLQECLIIQLRQLPESTQSLSLAITILEDHLDLLANRDYANLMRHLKITEHGLKSALDLIQTLNPNPGGQLSHTSETEYVTPDVIVRKINNRWRVELNPDVAPKLRVNANYASLIKRADSSADNNYLRNNLQEARWFIKSLQSRHETLLKVATCIVEHQRAFLEFGPEAMKAMVLRDIAEEVDMHESTISRVTTQKYMHTPRGVFELKYFFSSHVGTTGGGEASSTAIRAQIKKLIAQENPRKPLSDNKIADLLLEQGIEVARRTIAKYRESLNIPPSNERKQLV